MTAANYTKYLADILKEAKLNAKTQNIVVFKRSLLSSLEEIVEDLQDDVLGNDVTEQETEERKAMETLDAGTDEDVENSLLVAASKKFINRGFFLEKATKQYYHINELDAEKFADLSPADKIKHRNGIKTLYDTMLAEEIAKAEPQKHNEPNRKSFIKRIDAIDTTKFDVVSDAQKEWYHEQIQDLQQKIRICDLTISELTKKNEMKLSSAVLDLGLSQLEDTKEEKRNYERTLKEYQQKINN